MKKSALLVLFIVFLSVGAFAQKGFEIGFRAIPQGTILVNESDFAEGPELNYKSTWGFAGGLMLGYNFTDKFGIRTNVLYSNQGQQYVGDFELYQNIDTTSYSYTALLQNFLSNDTALTQTYSASVRHSYIKIPLLFRFNSDPTGGAAFSFEIGPQLNILRSAEHKFNGQTVSYSAADFDATNLYNPNVFGAVMQLGADIKLAQNFRLNTGIRLDYTFGNIENKDIVYDQVKFWNPARPNTSYGTAGFVVGLTYTFADGE